MMSKFGLAAIFAFALVGGSLPSKAVTIDFSTGAGNYTPYVEDGFQFSTARIVAGNCDDLAGGSGSNCLGENDNESTVLTQVGGGAFTLDSFWFEFLGGGTGNSFTITPSVGAAIVLLESAFPVGVEI